MRRKNLMTALMCTFCMAATTVSPMAVMAEEAAAVEVDSVDVESDGVDVEVDGVDVEIEGIDGAEEVGAEEVSADGTEAGTEAETPETEPLPERPDYTALDYVTLGEYKGLSVSLDFLRVTDEEVEAEIRSAMQRAELLETVSEGAVENGDTANIDYEGKLNGEAFEGGTAKAYDLVIGSGSFIPGFEDGLIGVAVGETVDVPVTFPENYGSEELAGQDVVFTVTVNEIKRAPELTDEHASTLSDGEYTDADSYRESVRASLQANIESQKESIIKSELVRQVAEASEVHSYPQELVEYGIASMKAEFMRQAEDYGMEFADYISAVFGLTEDTFAEEVESTVKQNMQQELILKAIAESESIEISDEEYEEGCENYRQIYGFETVEELEAQYDQKVIRMSLLQEKVVDYLVEVAVIEEESEQESESAADGDTSEAETEVASEAETEAVSEAETEAVSEAETEAVTEAISESGTEAGEE